MSMSTRVRIGLAALTVAATQLDGAETPRPPPTAKQAAADIRPEVLPVGAHTDPDWLRQARAAYPLVTCVACPGNLAPKRGRSREYRYRVQGHPDRLVRVCCKGCADRFAAKPEKYLPLIDAAQAGAPGAGRGHPGPKTGQK